jgi:hypothetical protein
MITEMMSKKKKKMINNSKIQMNKMKRNKRIKKRIIENIRNKIFLSILLLGTIFL